MDDPARVAVLLGFFGSAAFSVKVIAKAVLEYQRQEQKGLRSVGDAGEERLARIEQAVDAIAVEVERISEGQRFTTKLLSERAEKR